LALQLNSMSFLRSPWALGLTDQVCVLKEVMKSLQGWIITAMFEALPARWWLGLKLLWAKNASQIGRQRVEIREKSLLLHWMLKR